MKTYVLSITYRTLWNDDCQMNHLVQAKDVKEAISNAHTRLSKIKDINLKSIHIESIYAE